MFRFPYTIERGVRYPDEPIAYRGIRRHVIETLEPLVINERASERAEALGQPPIRQGEEPRATLWAPLVVGGEAAGVVSVQNLDREHAFDDGDVQLLVSLAASLSVSLETARLIEETSRRADEMSALADVAREISATLDVGAVLDRMTERLGDLLAVADERGLPRRAGRPLVQGDHRPRRGRGRDPRGHDPPRRGDHRHGRPASGERRWSTTPSPTHGRSRSPARNPTSRSG